MTNTCDRCNLMERECGGRFLLFRLVKLSYSLKCKIFELGDLIGSSIGIFIRTDCRTIRQCKILLVKSGHVTKCKLLLIMETSDAESMHVWNCVVSYKKVEFSML